VSSRSRVDRLFHLVTTLVGCSPDSPFAFAVHDLDGDESELALHALPGPDPVASLAGFRSPADWQAFGVVATGRARHLGQPSSLQPVTVAVVAERGGATVDALRTSMGVSTSVNGGEGRVPDACRRVLGLATAPPAIAPSAVFLLDWVDRALAAVLDADLGDPPELATLTALDRSDPHASWSDLRTRCATGRFTVPGISADAAAWMDDGMFSREAATAYPPLTSSLRDLSDLLPPPMFASLVSSMGNRLNAA
jgi:hypothetical protein